MMLSLLICCLTSLGLYLLLGKAGLSRVAKTAVFLLMALLVFSPAPVGLHFRAKGVRLMAWCWLMPMSVVSGLFLPCRTPP